MTRPIIVFILLCSFILQAFAQEELWRKRKSLPGDYPVPPQTDKSLFFMQGNMNKNTIVYDLQLDGDGRLNKKSPIDVYWMRYQENPNNPFKRKITWFQQSFVFGYKVIEEKDKFVVHLVSYKERKIYLKKNNKGQFEAFTAINGKNSYLTNLYVYADHSGLWPDIKYVDIFGIDPDNGAAVYEQIAR